MKRGRWSSLSRPSRLVISARASSDLQAIRRVRRLISRVLAAAVIATLIAWALIGPKPAAAETTSPDPSTSPVVAEARVLPIEGEVRDLTFPTANLDGSVTEEGTMITLKADVFFAYNKATLNAKAKAALDRAAARVTELQATTVRVSGYTDSKGTAAYNKALSQRRAKAVLAGLEQRLDGLTGVIKAYGESRPVAPTRRRRAGH